MNPLELINRIDTNFNIIFRTARIRIEQTKTNKEALKIEDIYLPKIRRIFKAIVKQYEGKIHFLHEAEKQYGIEIQTLIKSMVTRAYLLGIDYVSRATGKEHLMFLSNSDITNIMVQSDESYRMFWRLVTKHLQVLKNREAFLARSAAVSHHKHTPNITDVTITDEIFARRTEKDNRLLDPDTSAKLIGTGIVTSTVAFATLKKYRDFKTQQQIIQSLKELEGLDADNPLWTDLSYAKQQQILADYKRIIDEQTEQNNSILTNRQPPTTPTSTNVDLLEELKKQQQETDTIDFEDELSSDEGVPEKGDKVIFATEKDAKVCPTCSALEGEEWDVDDPTIVVPETDTHPHCRCRLLLKINGNIIAK